MKLKTNFALILQGAFDWIATEALGSSMSKVKAIFGLQVREVVLLKIGKGDGCKLSPQALAFARAPLTARVIRLAPYR